MNQTTFIFELTIDTKVYHARTNLKCLETDPDTLKNIWWKYIPSRLQELYPNSKTHRLCLDNSISDHEVFDIILSVSIENEEVVDVFHTSNIQPHSIDLENPIELIESQVSNQSEDKPDESIESLQEVHIEPDEPIGLENIVHSDKKYIKYAYWYGRHTNWNNL
jgi:hypothetical protein